jgi:hypothetical protein
MAYREPPPDQQQGFSSLNVVTIGYWLMCGWGACVWPFMRHSFGVRLFPKYGLAAIAAMYLYALFYPCPEEMFVFFCLWMVRIFWIRVETLSRGKHRHSLDDGVPFLANLLRPRDDFFAKMAVEGAILFFIAGPLLMACGFLGLGTFVAFGFIPLCVKRSLDKYIEDVQLRRWRDMQHEMAYRAARFRSGRF